MWEEVYPDTPYKATDNAAQNTKLNSWIFENEDLLQSFNKTGSLTEIKEGIPEAKDADEIYGEHSFRTGNRVVNGVLKSNPEPEFTPLPTRPLQTIPLVKKGTPGTVKPPASTLQWVKHPQTGTWYQIQRPVKPEDLKEYNLNTGSYLQDGGPINTSGPTASQKPVNEDAMNAMMKARLAYANEFGNPAAKRMINIPDNPYQFDNGDTGTHYMASYDNYAVPQIQDENGELVLGDYGPESNEAIRFDSDEDANYFAAENYKKISPGFINVELTDDEIQEYRDGGYIIEDLPKAQLAGVVKGLQGLKVIAPEINATKSLFTVANSVKLAPQIKQTIQSLNNISVPKFDLQKPISEPMIKSNLEKVTVFDHEIKNPDYFTQLLKTYTSKNLSSTNKKFYKDLIETVKKQNGLSTERQYNELQRLKTGNFDFGKFNKDNMTNVINFDYAPKLSSAEKLKVMFMNNVDKQKLLADKTVNEAFEYADRFMSDPEYQRRFADVKSMTPSIDDDKQDVANYIRNQVISDKINSDYYSKDEILNMTDEQILDNFENPYRYNTSNVAWDEANKLPAYVNRTLPIPQQTSVQHLKENIKINPFSEQKVGVYKAGINQSLTSHNNETVSVGSKNLGDLFNVTVHEALGHGKTFGNVSFTQKEKELLKSVFKTNNAASTYIKEPTEVMARIDEIRSVINRNNPFKEITENDLDRFESMVNTNKNIPGTGEKGSSMLEFISNIDKSKLKKVMNTMYGAAIIGGTAALMNNPWKQESPIKLKKGGSVDYKLGDKIDEATKIRLEQLGYTFEKI